MRYVSAVAAVLTMSGLLWAQSKPETKPAEKKDVRVELKVDEKGKPPQKNVEVILDVKDLKIEKKPVLVIEDKNVIIEKKVIEVEGVLEVIEGQPQSKPADKKAFKAEFHADGKDAKGDKQLDELEAKLQALLQEIQALRGGKASPPTDKPIRVYGKVETAPMKSTVVKPAPATSAKPAVGVVRQVPATGKTEIAGEKPQTLKATGEKGVVVWDKIETAKPAEGVRYRAITKSAGGDNVVTLSRATYQLPATSAKALNDFLSSQVKASVLEIKVEGDKVTVTTTPEVQQTIGSLIHLMQGKASTSSEKKSGVYRFELAPAKEAAYGFYRLETTPSKDAPQYFKTETLEGFKYEVVPSKDGHFFYRLAKPEEKKSEGAKTDKKPAEKPNSDK